MLLTQQISWFVFPTREDRHLGYRPLVLPVPPNLSRVPVYQDPRAFAAHRINRRQSNDQSPGFAT